MLKSVKRYVREQFERKVISKAEKVDNVRKPRPVCRHKYNTSFIPGYLKNVNHHFNSQFAALKYSGDHQHNDNNAKCKSSKCLDSCWIETVGLSGTLAFGWSLSQNIELKRKQIVEEILSLHYCKSCPLKSTLCPYIAIKNVFPKSVRAHPNEYLRPELKANDTKLPLPVFGPLTAEETLDEAKRGLERARNVAIAELENRMGLHCMSRRRYRRAIAHFAAGSALQNGSAAYNLAQCYELGLGTSKDLMKAAKYYQASSELGNATATFNLAVYYAQGLGGLKCDSRKARELLEKAVELGEPNAKILLEKRVNRDESTKEEVTKFPENQIQSLVNSVAEDETQFPEINENKITPKEAAQPMCTMTKTSLGTNVQNDSFVRQGVDKGRTKFSFLDMKNYDENNAKLAINFDDPVIPQKEFCGRIPLIMQLCGRKISSVQSQ